MLIFDPTFLTLTLTLLIMTLHSDELVIVKKLTDLTTPLRTVTHTYTPTPTSKGSGLGNVKIKDPQAHAEGRSSIFPLSFRGGFPSVFIRPPRLFSWEAMWYNECGIYKKGVCLNDISCNA